METVPTMKTRQYTPFDLLIMNLDQALRTLAGKPLVSGRPDPADDVDEAPLSEVEQLCDRVLIIGDILHSRVARSDIMGFKMLGMDITLVAPPTLMPRGIEEMGKMNPDSSRVGSMDDNRPS